MYSPAFESAPIANPASFILVTKNIVFPKLWDRHAALIPPIRCSVQDQNSEVSYDRKQAEGNVCPHVLMMQNTILKST